MAETDIDIANVLHAAAEEARSERERAGFLCQTYSALNDSLAWRILFYEKLDERGWHNAINHAVKHGLLTRNVVDAFFSFAELARLRNPTQTVTAPKRTVLMLYEDTEGKVGMAVVKQQQQQQQLGTATLYTVADHPDTVGDHATMPQQLQQDVDDLDKQGAPPLDKVLVKFSNGTLWFKHYTQSPNKDLQGSFTPYQLRNRAYFAFHGTNPNHTYRGGWFVNADAWTREPVAMRTRSCFRVVGQG